MNRTIWGGVRGKRTVITKVNYQGSSGPERTIITKVNYQGSEEVARRKRRLQKQYETRIKMINEEKLLAEEREKLASIRWLREQWEILQHKRAKGYELDDYEMRLAKQYEESIKTG